ncbi:MAG: hypothetical protein QG622_2664 [Actinomycetota bacterium]|nr:hypothetical protein [Actinomycetota bacterium]
MRPVTGCVSGGAGAGDAGAGGARPGGPHRRPSPAQGEIPGRFNFLRHAQRFDREDLTAITYRDRWPRLTESQTATGDPDGCAWPDHSRGANATSRPTGPSAAVELGATAAGSSTVRLPTVTPPQPQPRCRSRSDSGPGTEGLGLAHARRCPLGTEHPRQGGRLWPDTPTTTRVSAFPAERHRAVCCDLPSRSRPDLRCCQNSEGTASQQVTSLIRRIALTSGHVRRDVGSPGTDGLVAVLSP